MSPAIPLDAEKLIDEANRALKKKKQCWMDGGPPGCAMPAEHDGLHLPPEDVQRCEVCGREYTEEEGHLTGERGPAACYRLGYERLGIQNTALADALEAQRCFQCMPTEPDEEVCDACRLKRAALRAAGRLP